jgi:hypothetical protein
MRLEFGALASFFSTPFRLSYLKSQFACFFFGATSRRLFFAASARFFFGPFPSFFGALLNFGNFPCQPGRFFRGAF